MINKKFILMIVSLSFILLITGCSGGGLPGNDNNNDITAPTILSTIPANGESDISINTAINIAFSEPMKKSTVISAISGLDIKPEATWISDSEVICSLESSLAYNSEYTVSIATDAEDINGNNLYNTYNFTFNTATDSSGTGTISGTISYDAGTLTGTNIIVFGEMDMENDMPDFDTLEVTQELTDTENGTYNISDIPVGSYYVAAYRDINGDGQINDCDPTGIYENISGDPVKVTVTDGGIETETNIELEAAIYQIISGNVSDLTDSNLNGVTVKLYNQNNIVETCTSTASEPGFGDGYYSFAAPAGTNYYLECSIDGYFDSLSPIFYLSEDLTDIHIPLLEEDFGPLNEEDVDISDCGAIIGDIYYYDSSTDSDKYIPNVSIDLVPDSGDTGYVIDEETLTIDYNADSTYNNGKYIIKNVAPCTISTPYDISASDTDDYTFSSQEIVVKKGKVTFVSFEAE